MDDNSEDLIGRIIGGQGLNKRTELPKVPQVFDIGLDLQFYHGTKKKFSRADALMVIVIKSQILRDFKVISQYLESVICKQGVEYLFMDPEKPDEGLVEIFNDLKMLAYKIPESEIPELLKWKLDFLDILGQLHNSAFYFQHGKHRYWFKSKQYDGYVGDLLVNFSLNVPEKEKTGGNGEVKPPAVDITEPIGVRYEEIREALKVGGKNENFTKHFRQLGIKTFGGYKTPQISPSDFEKLKEFWINRKRKN